jgi:beta-lactamase class A
MVHTMEPMRKFVCVLAVVVFLLGGCANESTSNDSQSTTTSVALPSTPAGDQLTWVLQHGGTATDDELRQHFSADFLQAVPADQLRAGLKDGPDTTIVNITKSDDTSLDAIVKLEGDTKFQLSIVVDATSHLITGFLIRPGELPASPTTWDEVDQRLAKLAPTTAFLAAEVGPDKALSPVRSSNADTAGPIGSAFKLYVLGAVANAVRAGTLAWTDTLTIRPDLKSLPSGELQERADNSTLTVQEAAEKMIAISDNTATDLLIDRVGKPAVEAMFTEMGMSPSSQQRTLPLLTTRELFILKWGVPATVRDEYASASVDRRRQLLAEHRGDPLPPVAAVDPKVPVAPDTLEWFASPEELAHAQVWLDVQQLTNILGANPGIPLDKETWPSVSFKGGSEPGVVTLSWLAHRKDGRVFVVVLMAEDVDHPLDELDAASIGQGIFGLMAG